MRPRIFIVRSILIAVAALWSQHVHPQQVYSQDATPPKAAEETVSPLSARETVTREQIELLRTGIEEATELTPDAKKTAQDFIQSAINSLAATADFIEREKKAKEALDQVDVKRADLKSKLNSLQMQSGLRQQLTDLKAELQDYIDDLLRQRKPRYSIVDQFLKYEQTLAQKKNRLVQTQAELDAIQARINSRTERQRIRKERFAAIPAEKEKLQKHIAQLPVTPEDLGTKAEKYARLAERQRLAAEPTALQAEITLSNAEEAATLSQIDRQLKSLELEQLKQQILLYADVLNRARKIDASNRKANAERQLKTARESNELWQRQLVEIYEENIFIIEQELEVQAKLKKIQNDVDKVENDRTALAEEFEQVKSRSGRTGSSRSFGIRLRQQRDLLPDTIVLRHNAYQEMLPYEEAQLKYFDLREERKPLDDIEDEVEAFMQIVISDSLSEERSDQEIEDHYRKAFDEQREFLSHVITAYSKYLQELENYESEQLQLADLSEQVADYIDERVLWIRSHEPLTFDRLSKDLEELSILSDGRKWREIRTCLASDFWSHLFLYSLLLVVWVFLLVTQTQQSTRIKQTGKKAGSRLNLSIKPTIQAFLMTLSKSCILPLPVLFLSWRLAQGASSFSLDIVNSKNLILLANNLQIVGGGLFFLEFIRNVHRPHGLAVSHFNWPEHACQVVSVQVRSLIFFITPLVLIIAILDAWKADNDIDVLIRVLTIGVLILLAHVLHRLANNETGALSPLAQRHKNGWIDRFASLFHFMAVAVPVSMAILTGIGFSYTTNQIAVKLALTAVLLFSVLFTRAFLFRGLSLRHRRMAVEQARQARAALANEEHKTETVTQTLQNEARENQTALADLSAQTRRLLNTTIVVLTLLGVYLIWTDVLPALHYFDEISLPGTTIRIPSIFSAIVIAILTTTAARNIPGLLQITLLEWLPLEKSVRYTIAAVTQYCIAIVGLLAISGQLEIGWSQVQWLAAALTFGLGFGLQEIFANFVSGLIILFEQPVRVGDVVTIDGVSGVVSRIRIRSTTITNWDRQEYIVPNREFITGKLLNWTLTDTTNRFSIVVGVAYGTDPKRVHEILTKIVQDHPATLNDPKPIITFDEFGDSSLNFTIRAYLPSLDGRLQIIHELHIAIDTAFAAAKIEIPFPQRDLNLRSTADFPIVTDAPQPQKNSASSNSTDSTTEG